MERGDIIHTKDEWESDIILWTWNSNSYLGDDVMLKTKKKSTVLQKHRNYSLHINVYEHS